MKRLILLFTIAIPVLINAQQPTDSSTPPAANSAKELVITQAENVFTLGKHASMEITIPQAKLSDVDKSWQKYIKSGSKNKPEVKDGITSIKGAINKNVSPQGFDLYSKLIGTTDGVKMIVWFVREDSIYMSSATGTDRDLAAEKYLHDFAVGEYKYAVKDELKAEQDKLKSLEDELKEFIKDEEKSNKKINENERSIERQKNAIQANNNDQKNKAEQIGAQKKVVEQQKAISADAGKDAAKVQKGFESELKKLEKENEKLNKDIDDWEKEIREEGRNIDKSKQNQALKNEDIEKQRKAINAVQNKLDNIK